MEIARVGTSKESAGGTSAKSIAGGIGAAVGGVGMTALLAMDDGGGDGALAGMLFGGLALGGTAYTVTGAVTGELDGWKRTTGFVGLGAAAVGGAAALATRNPNFAFAGVGALAASGIVVGGTDLFQYLSDS